MRPSTYFLVSFTARLFALLARDPVANLLQTNALTSYPFCRLRCAVRISDNTSKNDRLLLNRGSLETCPPELRGSLAYILHLRSHWKPEARTKLIVPTSWMGFLALTDGQRGKECVALQRCPFRNIRFESAAKDEELPRGIVSQLLTDFAMEDSLATLVPCAFQGIPGTSPRSDIAATSHLRSPSTLGRIDFALVSEDDVWPQNNIRCLLLGMKEPSQSQMQRSPAVSFDFYPRPFALPPIPEELTSHTGHGQFHLTLLTSLVNGVTAEIATDHFPEWLVLFGLAYDAHRVRVIAYLPLRHTSGVIRCAAYIVDELSFRSGPVPGVPACELVVERLRLLLALTTLRRHVLHLSKSLFTAIDPCDGIGRTDRASHPSLLTCDHHSSDDFESLEEGGSFGSSSHCSSKYSTCPSVNDDIPIFEYGQECSASCGSFASSFCSTCSSLLASDDTFYTEDSKYASSSYMEPSTIALSQEGNEDVACTCPNQLTETKRRAIIAWARDVIRTEHPVKDTYKMVISHSHPRQRTLADFKSSTGI